MDRKENVAPDMDSAFEVGKDVSLGHFSLAQASRALFRVLTQMAPYDPEHVDDLMRELIDEFDQLGSAIFDAHAAVDEALPSEAKDDGGQSLELIAARSNVDTAYIVSMMAGLYVGYKIGVSGEMPRPFVTAMLNDPDATNEDLDRLINTAIHWSEHGARFEELGNE